MGASSEASEGEKSIRSQRTAVPGTPVPGSRNTTRHELGYGGTPSPPLTLKRVRPRAIRGEESLYSLKAVSPAASLGAISLRGGTSRYKGAESPLGSLRSHAPYVLVPNVTVTPEVEVVGNGEVTMWIGVEIGAQLGRPDGTGAMAGTNGWGTLHHGLSEYGADIYIYDMGADCAEQVLSLMDAFTTCRQRSCHCPESRFSISSRTTRSLCKSGRAWLALPDHESGSDTLVAQNGKSQHSYSHAHSGPSLAVDATPWPPNLQHSKHAKHTDLRGTVPRPREPAWRRLKTISPP